MLGINQGKDFNLYVSVSGLPLREEQEEDEKRKEEEKKTQKIDRSRENVSRNIIL